MGWKKKEKELTPEEALALAVANEKPYWIHSAPQFAALNETTASGQARPTLHPLNPEFEKKTWAFLFIDITDCAGESALLFAKEWSKRYREFEINFLIVFTPATQYTNDPAFVNQILEGHGLKIPCVIDHTKNTSVCFKAESKPKLVLYDKGKTLYSQDANTPQWQNQFELKLQSFLRTTDPGLPLAPTYEPGTSEQKDIDRVDFEKPAPWKIEKFNGQTLEEKKLLLSGEWSLPSATQNFLTTQDPDATLQFLCPSEGFTILAKVLAKTIDPARIFIETDGSPPFEAFAGKDLHFDEAGQSYCDAKELGMRVALIGLPPESRQITLRLPTSKRAQIALYGFRFFK